MSIAKFWGTVMIASIREWVETGDSSTHYIIVIFFFVNEVFDFFFA